MLDVGKRERSRVRRHHRVRLRVFGTAQRPRLNVFRSNGHLYAQVIDDTTGRTLLSASTLDKELKGTVKNGGNATAAVAVGRLVAERALKANVTAVVFDRGGYKYHGRIKALAEAAREKGLKF
ncbi:MAG: 50S ribosomal protein L18 [Nitrospirae bacterium]|nr:MAG: 50S ribosomal protein L18 [Nitrospirota bacterium]